MQHPIRVDAGEPERDETGARLETEPAGSRFAHDEDGRGAVDDLARVASGDNPVGQERGLERGELLGRCVAAPAIFAVDEAARRETSLAALAALAPAFRPNGVVTAGNSSQIVDGAAAVLIASEAALDRLGLVPRARFVSFGLAGVDPTRMLHGNPEAMRKALARAALTLDDMGVIEVNEAFASVVLQTVADLRLEDRLADVNPNGGGISLGHPLGATGARITATLLDELERRGARYGIASMCVGFGMAIAGILERV